MRSFATLTLDSTDTALLFALTLRRLGQLWRRAERAAPDSWVSFADRVGPELVPEAVRSAEVGRVATGLAGAAAENRGVSGLQAVTIWADALAAGYGYTPGEALTLESERGLTDALPATAVPAELGSALLATDRPPLYWPLVPQPERPEPVAEEALPRPVGETDYASLYQQRLFKLVKEKLAALTPEGLCAGILEVLEIVRHVPVELANGRLVGMREHVLCAASLAAALRRAVQAKLDDGASTWVEPQSPYWLLTVLHVEPTPPLSPTAALQDEMARSAAAQRHLDAVSARIAALLEVPSLDAFQLAELGPGRVLLSLPVTATEPVNRVLGEIRGELADQASLGLSGVPLGAAALCGPEASVAGQVAEVAREAQLAAQRFARAATTTEYAALFELQSSNGSADATTPAPPAGEQDKTTGGAALALLRPATTDANAHRQNTAARGALAVPAWQGLSLAELAAGLAQAAEVAQHVAALLPAAAQAVVHALPDGTTWLAADVAALPGLVERAVEAHTLWWGNRPPFALSAALVAGTEVAYAESAWSAAQSASRPLPVHVAQIREKQPELSLPERLVGASVSFFARLGADGRGLVPLEDLRVVIGMSTHVLGLAGTRRDEDTGRVVRVGRGDGTVTLLCAQAAREALPGAAEPADPRWRARLTYRLMSTLGLRRQYSRKRKALPNPVDQLVEVVRSNHWEALNRKTVRETALYLDLAARWALGVLPHATEEESAT